MKVKLHKSDLEKMLAVLEAIQLQVREDAEFELEVDDSEKECTTGYIHVPVRINSLPGTFTYMLWSEENW